MNKIITINDIARLVEELHNDKQEIVLVGGCFDILHQGHLEFLTQAKAQGDSLWVLLEHDRTIRERKGDGKPVNTQADRAKILAAVPSVDHIVLLSDSMTHADYDKVVLLIKPAIIATTKGDLGIEHKKRQAALLGSSVIEVIERIPDLASSALAEQIR